MTGAKSPATTTTAPAQIGFIATPTDVDNAREPPKLTITDHSLSVAASGSVLLPISVTANDADDTVSVKISGLPSFETITAGDGHAVAKMGDSYTFTLADVQSGLTLHSSFDRKDHPDHDDREHDRDEGEHSEHRFAAEQSKLTVTAFNTTVWGTCRDDPPDHHSNDYPTDGPPGRVIQSIRGGRFPR